MARSTTGIHLTLIFVSALALGLMFAVYHFGKKSNEETDKRQAAQAELATEQQARRKQHDEIEALKQLIGHVLTTVGVDDPDNPATVIGKGHEELQSFGGNLAQQNYTATLIALSDALDSVTRERDALQDDLNVHKERILALQNQYQEKVDEYLQAMQSAEGDRETAQRTLEETVASKDRALQEQTDELKSLQLLFAEEQEARQNEREQLTTRVAQLTEINDKLRDEKSKRENLSYETADGSIVHVDYNTNLVWIDIGSADNLPRRLTFSVYRQNHEGVGRNSEDIKGAIEITQILGDHLAEALIRWDLKTDPVALGDEIYTPVWSRNLRPRFSVVGLIDFDDDGQSDRPYLHDLIREAGASIDNEIDDQGYPQPEDVRLDVSTKFLVVGEIPRWTESAPQDQDAHRRIATEHNNMMDQAREQGVRVVTLKSFLDYMGYKPRRRLWVPGSDVPYTLKSSARNVATDRSPKRPRVSTGRTSGLYRGSEEYRSPGREESDGGR